VSPNSGAWRPADTSIPLESSGVGDALRKAAVAYPERVAVMMPKEDSDAIDTITYQHLLEAAEDLARRLLGRAGVGGRVAVWSKGSITWIIAEYACALSGLVMIPLNPALTDSEAKSFLELTDPAVVLTGAEFRGSALGVRAEALAPRHSVIVDLERWRDLLPSGAAAALPTVDPVADFLIQPTSGTTGRPRGVVLSQWAALENARTAYLHYGPQEHERMLSPLPMHHVAGSVSVPLGLLSIGGTRIVQPTVNARQALQLVQSTGATALGAVPTLLIDMLRDPEFARFDLSSLKLVQLGGAPIAPSLVGRIEEAFGAFVMSIYGQSELSYISATSRDDANEIKAETIGRPLAHREARIVRPGSDDTADLDEVGELLISSPLIFKEYFGDPGATKAALRDGWLYTGDLCSMDAAGVLRFHGRSRDVVIRGGENIYPAEVEHVLALHDSIAEVAIAGLPDERLGETVAAWVRLPPGTDFAPEDVERWAAERLAWHKVPRHWTIVDDFPRTASGKIQKFRLPGHSETLTGAE
jgi:fatty-acyl-CoA synthase